MVDEQQAQTTFAEKALVGALLHDASITDRLPIIGTHFFHAEFGRAYDLIANMRASNTPVDIASIVLALKGAKGSYGGKSLFDDLGGSSGLAQLGASAAVNSAEFYASEVARWHSVRKLRYRLQGTLVDLDVMNVDPTRVAMNLEGFLNGLSVAAESKESFKFGEMAAYSLVSAYSQRSDISVPYGYRMFDTILGGLYASEMTILAARPSVGKSALGFGIALNAAKAGKHVKYISCEMSRDQLGHRLLSIETGIPIFQIRNNTLDDDQRQRLSAAVDRVKPITGNAWIAARPTVQAIRARAKMAQASVGLDLLVVDYLGLLQATCKGSQYEKVTELSADLKSLATELDVPVLVLAQLSREAGKSDDPPKLEHLRDSGSIEQDANNVIFIHRKRGEDETLIVVAKQRQGEVTSFPMRFNPDRCCFEDRHVYVNEDTDDGGGHHYGQTDFENWNA